MFSNSVGPLGLPSVGAFEGKQSSESERFFEEVSRISKDRALQPVGPERKSVTDAFRSLGFPQHKPVPPPLPTSNSNQNIPRSVPNVRARQRAFLSIICMHILLFWFMFVVCIFAAAFLYGSRVYSDLTIGGIVTARSLNVEQDLKASSINAISSSGPQASSIASTSSSSQLTLRSSFQTTASSVYTDSVSSIGVGLAQTGLWLQDGPTLFGRGNAQNLLFYSSIPVANPPANASIFGNAPLPTTGTVFRMSPTAVSISSSSTNTLLRADSNLHLVPSAISTSRIIVYTAITSPSVGTAITIAPASSSSSTGQLLVGDDNGLSISMPQQSTGFGRTLRLTGQQAADSVGSKGGALLIQGGRGSINTTSGTQGDGGDVIIQAGLKGGSTKQDGMIQFARDSEAYLQLDSNGIRTFKNFSVAPSGVLGAPVLSVWAAGASVTGSASISGALIAGGPLTVASSGMTITGPSTLNGPLTVSSGISTFAGGLSATGSSTITGRLTINTGATAQPVLSIVGDSLLTGSLSVQSSVAPATNLLSLAAASGLTATTDTTINGKLAVWGKVATQAAFDTQILNVFVQQTGSMAAPVYTATAAINGRLRVFSAASDVLVVDPLVAGGTTTFTGSIAASATDGTSYLQASSSAVSIRGPTVNQNAFTASTTLTVVGTSSFQNTLTVTSGGATITGLLTLLNGIDVTGSSRFRNPTVFDQQITVSSGGVSVSSGDSLFNGKITSSQGMFALGVGSFAGGVTANGNSTFGGQVDMNGPLSVFGGGATISGALNVFAKGARSFISDGLTITAGGLISTGTSTIAGALTVSVVSGQALTVTGSSSAFTGQLAVSDASPGVRTVTMLPTPPSTVSLSVVGQSILRSVDGTVTQPGVSVTGTTSLTGATSVTGKLTVSTGDFVVSNSGGTVLSVNNIPNPGASITINAASTFSQQATINGYVEVYGSYGTPVANQPGGMRVRTGGLFVDAQAQTLLSGQLLVKDASKTYFNLDTSTSALSIAADTTISGGSAFAIISSSATNVLSVTQAGGINTLSASLSTATFNADTFEIKSASGATSVMKFVTNNSPPLISIGGASTFLNTLSVVPGGSGSPVLTISSGVMTSTASVTINGGFTVFNTAGTTSVLSISPNLPTPSLQLVGAMTVSETLTVSKGISVTSGPVNIQNGGLTVTAGASPISLQGSTTVTGSLTVNGSPGTLSATTLSIASSGGISATFGGQVNVNGDVVLSPGAGLVFPGGINMRGSSSPFTSVAISQGGLQILNNNDLSVTGNTQIAQTLTVTGTSTFTGKSTHTGGVYVSDASASLASEGGFYIASDYRDDSFAGALSFTVTKPIVVISRAQSTSVSLPTAPCNPTLSLVVVVVKSGSSSVAINGADSAALIAAGGTGIFTRYSTGVGACSWARVL